MQPNHAPPTPPLKYATDQPCETHFGFTNLTIKLIFDFWLMRYAAISHPTRENNDNAISNDIYISYKLYTV